MVIQAAVIGVIDLASFIFVPSSVLPFSGSTPPASVVRVLYILISSIRVHVLSEELERIVSWSVGCFDWRLE